MEDKDLIGMHLKFQVNDGYATYEVVEVGEELYGYKMPGGVARLEHVEDQYDNYRDGRIEAMDGMVSLKHAREWAMREERLKALFRK